jgi:magnesium-transporting ATPase (P-type)
MLDVLQVNPATGLQTNEISERREVFGTNMRAPHKTRGFCQIIWDALGDTLLRVLLCCGIISIIIDESTDDDKSIGILALPYWL